MRIDGGQENASSRSALVSHCLLCTHVSDPGSYPPEKKETNMIAMTLLKHMSLKGGALSS